jgi:8-oxo-dGTP diphosphatase
MIKATAAILMQNEKVLIARRKARFRFGGKWEFPGGKVEEGETAEQCLIREIKEEFNIDIEIVDFFTESVFQYEHGLFQLLAYEVTWLSGRLDPRDHDEYEWAKPEALLTFDLLPADIPIAMKLIGK